MLSSVRACTPTAFEYGVGASFFSTTRTAIPCWRSNAAVAMPTGPAPITKTGTKLLCTLQPDHKKLFLRSEQPTHPGFIAPNPYFQIQTAPMSNSLRPIDLNLFKVLLSIYNQRNLTHAGKQLAMTQPAVSRALERLNYIFNERLFVRIDGEMRPTRTTEMIAPLIFEGMALLEAAVNMASGFDPKHISTSLKLGLNDYGIAIVLPKLIQRVSDQAPSVFLTTMPATYQDAHELIERSEIDCAIVSSLPNCNRLATDPLFREDYVAVCSNQHPSISDGLDLTQFLAAEHLLVSYKGHLSGWVDERLAEMGKKRRVVGSVHSFNAIPELLCQRPYLCVLPRRLAQHFAKAYPLRINELPFPSENHLFHFIRLRHLTKNPISNWIRDQVVETCQELV
ncbi:LysR family transcriptional regulator [Jeongeupia sp. HS-3]|uniref:LysR family transcriptional regulator n=1 Tax=Jeongeupia sp. HS-3 TaxID=1009682 RepID=UPI001F421508|nr:LysR family transcriptional regulator [Jeongeupia sp. HS-3]